MKDALFTKDIKAQFEFNQDVADVFDDMIDRSVPFYKENLNLSIDIISNYLLPNDKVVDLGCSTATFLINLANKQPDLQLIGIDSSQAMIQKAQQKAKAFGVDITFWQQDFFDATFTNTKLIVANYTLQFVRPIKREKLIQKIYNSLSDNGVFLMSEKLISSDKRLNKILIDEYYNYKKQKGYSQYEIAKKREALENVLIPYTQSENEEMLLNSGFRYVEVIFRWCNFATFIAFK
ncbi:MAG: carboxy-S-adenosyl-L-methionine synthase CmoA [Epsilonproteobacteria bacterium]|nr:carboxy-S-adenosyl-L-methionine synthase CmoA [Campylobacterota bacterium]